MNPHDPIFIAPPPTEVPDYILYRQYEEPRFLPGKPVRKPKDMSEWFFHPTAEAALQAAKRACRIKPGRWIGHNYGQNPEAAFLVFEGGKVIERHVIRSE